MAIYYFHLLDGESFEEDTDGVELLDLDAAHREALRAAREMLIEQVALGLPVTDQVFEVCDEFGILLFKLAFKDVLHS